MTIDSALPTAVGDESVAIRRFRPEIREDAIADLRTRIRATRWPERETVGDATQGVQLDTMERLVAYWAKEYDFDRVARRLNAFPQFITEIDRLDIHFIHVRSRHEGALDRKSVV